MQHTWFRSVLLLAVVMLLVSAAGRLSPAARSDERGAPASATFKTLANFGAGDGEYPNGFLGQATDGNFYSTTYGGGTNRRGVVFKMTPTGAVTNLYDFCAASGCGWYPTSGLIQGTDGDSYGTTAGGATRQFGLQDQLNGRPNDLVRVLPAAPLR